MRAILILILLNHILMHMMLYPNICNYRAVLMIDRIIILRTDQGPTGLLFYNNKVNGYPRILRWLG